MITVVFEMLSQILLITSAVLCGIYMIFSNTIMPSLAKQTDGVGMEAMQLINRKIQNPVFFAFFFGSPGAALALLIMQTLSPGIHGNILTLLAACLAIAALLSTVLINVPLNNRLDRAQPDSEQGRQIWQHYLDRWVWWNHVRTLCTLLSAILMMIAMVEY